MTGIVIAQQFCGPPTSGNGGYCAGLLARNLAGPVIAVLKARIPLDVTLDLSSDSAGSILTGPEGEVIGEAGISGLASGSIPSASRADRSERRAWV